MPIDDRNRRAPRRDALPPCPHRPPCTACPRYGEPGIAPAARQALAALARRYGLATAGEVSGPSTGFRLRARLAIRGRLGAPKLGLFRHGSHDLVHVPDCVVHHPLINEVAEVVRRALVEARVSCYSEHAHAGLARYLQVTVERSSATAQVVLVGNSATRAPFDACLALIRERLGARLHSLWFNANCERSNVILGPAFEHCAGPATVVERFGGAAIHYPPGAFGQSNLAVAERIIGDLRREVPGGARVVEFYAGVGAIGLSLLGVAGEVRLNEIGAHSLAGLERGIDGLDAAERARVAVLAGAAATACHAAAGADVVIVDPPRRGLDAELAAVLGDQPPQRLLYVSCNLDSLLRDSVALTAHGRLRLGALTAYDLLPFTDHVETVARFERV